MSPARIIRIARLVLFDELKQHNLSELLRLPSFMLVKQCEDPSAYTLLPILQSQFGSAKSEPFTHFQRTNPRTTTTGNMNGSQNSNMKFIYFLLSNSNKTSNNPESKLARLVNKGGDGKGILPTNVSSRKVLILCTDNYKELVSTLP